MGLLDEAIREHLELKRRSGADPGEVARMERDALGPVVRGDPFAEPPTPETTTYEEPLEAEPMVLSDQGGEFEAGEHAEPAVPAEGLGGEALPEEPPLPLEHGAPTGQETEEYDVEAAQAAAEGEVETALPERHGEGESGHEPAVETDGEREAEHDERQADPQSEDVLEQTPEFLQETPEHDRLWFEQGPPQEFDFDK
jgi:hypothetical protein